MVVVLFLIIIIVVIVMLSTSGTFTKSTENTKEATAFSNHNATKTRWDEVRWDGKATVLTSHWNAREQVYHLGLYQESHDAYCYMETCLSNSMFRDTVIIYPWRCFAQEVNVRAGITSRISGYLPNNSDDWLYKAQLKATAVFQLQPA